MTIPEKLVTFNFEREVGECLQTQGHYTPTHIHASENFIRIWTKRLQVRY